MTDQPTRLNLDEIEAAIAAYQQHAPTGFTCCTAHPVADAGAALVAEVRRLRAQVAEMDEEHDRWVGVHNVVERAIDKGASTIDLWVLEDALGPAPAAARLLDCGWCYEEQGEEVHPHPECPIGAAPATAAGVAGGPR